MAGIRYKGQIFSGAASFGDADHVAYDNTESGLTATNVQGAVDEITTTSSLGGLYKELQSHNLIPDNSDLDDYITPGAYHVINAASAQTIAHSPMSAAYTLNVEIIGADWVHQTARQAADIVEYERYRHPGTAEWSAWRPLSQFTTVRHETGNITFGTTPIRWEIAVTKPGYRPLMFSNLIYGNSTTLIGNSEGVTLSDGAFKLWGYFKSANTYSYAANIGCYVLWMRIST